MQWHSLRDKDGAPQPKCFKASWLHKDSRKRGGLLFHALILVHVGLDVLLWRARARPTSLFGFWCLIIMARTGWQKESKGPQVVVFFSMS